MKNIVLYGMRGTGKSIIGEKLSIELGIKFYDLDKSIEKDVGEPLNSYIQKVGFPRFREKETEILKIIINQNENKVISLGGGTIIFEKNSKILLKKSDKLIFIETDIEEITKRIINDEKSGNKRNALTNKGLIEELIDVYLKRKDIYNKFYDFKVSNNTSIDNCVKDILKHINTGNICVPIINFSTLNLIKEIEIINNSREIKFVELRIDFIEKNNLNNVIKIIASINKQIIITNRNILEGGNFKGSFEESIKMIEKFKEVGDFFDIELLAGNNILELKKIIGNKKIIISYHDFEKTPSLEFLKNKIIKMQTYNPDIYKIALMPKNESDEKMIYSLQDYFIKNYTGFNHIFISMGKLGKNSRINIPMHGGFLTFGLLNKSSAPGQIDYKELNKLLF